MTLRSRLAKLEAKLPEDANRWQAADEFLELATSEELRRLHELQQACIAKMPLGGTRRPQ